MISVIEVVPQSSICILCQLYLAPAIIMAYDTDMKTDIFEALLEHAIEEDLGAVGDITSDAVFDDDNHCTALLVSKDTGILAGEEYFRRVFNRIDPKTAITFLYKDGDKLEKGCKVAEISGKTTSILSAERIALNFLAYLSGIATISNRYVISAAAAGKAVILDTRKTLPGYRKLAKYAVAAGGGTNHRMGLYDMVMIKDNHIDAAGSIAEAVSRVRACYSGKYRIEVECRNASEVRDAVDAGADIIMLDNMKPEEVEGAVKSAGDSVLFEASGDMDMEKIRRYAGTGVDYISVGRLTHSVASFDFSIILETPSPGTAG